MARFIASRSGPRTSVNPVSLTVGVILGITLAPVSLTVGEVIGPLWNSFHYKDMSGPGTNS